MYSNVSYNLVKRGIEVFIKLKPTEESITYTLKISARGNSKTVKSFPDEMPDLLIDYLRRNSPVKEIVNSKLTVKA